MPACEACGGQGKRPEMVGRRIVWVTCSVCRGSAKMATPHPQNYPPAVIAALQEAGQKAQQAATLNNLIQQATRGSQT